MRRLEGAYSVVAIVDGDAWSRSATRTGSGRSSLGRIGDDWVVASESCALDLVGAVVVRDVRPGEVVWLDEDGLHTRAGAPRGPRTRRASSSTSTSRGPTRASAARRCTSSRVRMGAAAGRGGARPRPTS